MLSCHLHFMCRARAASRKVQALPSSEREAMVQRVADALVAAQAEILAENAADVEQAKGAISRMSIRYGQPISAAKNRTKHTKQAGACFIKRSVQ
eukprot:1158446-Pelagomonas_calceolata.AAC.11